MYDLTHTDLTAHHSAATEHLGVSYEPQTPLFPEHISYTDTGQPVVGPAPSVDVTGHPGTDAWDWQFQHENGLCGPTSIAMVVNEFGLVPGGHPLTGLDVAQWAVGHGEMMPDGRYPSPAEYGYDMNVEQISTTLDHFGVQNEVVQGGSLALLETYLQTGHEVILGVDGDRIWHDIPAYEDAGRANHAVVLTGIDPRTGYAYLNDPGSPDGRMEAVPIQELMSAWSTSGYTAVVTDHVPVSHETVTPPSHTTPTPTVRVPGSDGGHSGAVILPAVLHHELVTLKQDVDRFVEQFER
jgi:hypothetical protein